VSFLAFCGANVLVDVEPRLLDIFGLRNLRMRAVTLGAIAGTYSHVVLDSLLHADMRPFAPFSAANPLLGLSFSTPCTGSACLRVSS
jgi:membrane-bound metal-dependent hydrolase YbcI (DUF457 family)